MPCLHSLSNCVLDCISCHTQEHQGTMAPRQFGINCHALLTNIKRTVCFRLLYRAVLFTAVSLSLYGITTASRVDRDKLKATSSLTLYSSDNHMLPGAKRSIPFALCTQYSFVGKRWWMFPKAIWFCFKISLDEESKNIPCRLATIWQSYLLWHVNTEFQPKWNMTPHAAWVLITDIFTKLL